jgi:putative adhesin
MQFVSHCEPSRREWPARTLLACALLAALPAALAATPPPAEEAINADAGAPKAIDRSYSFAAEGTIEVSNVRGSVTINGTNQNTISLTGSLGAGSRLAIDGGESHLELRVESEHQGGWLGNHGPANDTTLVLNVPHSVALKLDLVSADSKVSGIDGKSLDVDNVSGKVQLSGAARSIEVDSVSGNVTLDIAKAGAVERAHLQTVSGDIRATGADGRVKLETVSGSINYTAPTVAEFNAESVSGTIDATAAPAKNARVHLETMSGHLRLHLPADLSARLTAETFSGNIKSDFGTVSKAEFGPGSSLDARVGDGNARIETESFSGSIELRKQ